MSIGPLDIGCLAAWRPITPAERAAISEWLERHVPECQYFIANWQGDKLWARIWYGPGRGSGPSLDMSIALESMEQA